MVNASASTFSSVTWTHYVVLLIPFISYIAFATYRFGSLEVEVGSLREDLDRQTADRYHASTARSDRDLTNERINVLSKHIVRIEEKFNDYPPQWLLNDFQELRQLVRNTNEELRRRYDQAEKWNDTLWPRVTRLEEAVGVKRAPSVSPKMRENY